MKITLKVQPYEGDAYEVQTDLWVLVQWERKTRRKLADLVHGPGAEDLQVLAYYACRRAGITVPASLDDYAQGIESIEPGSEAPANPTVAAPTDAP